MDERERHNRTIMLQRVKTFWLVGVLQESLHGAEIIDLSMAYRTTAVASSHAPEWQDVPGLEGEAFDHHLPIGTKITDVYQQAQGTLLIMGEPGAGKTTTLLQLVSDLLMKAELDENHPIPVVFSLASWTGNGGIGAWMVDELANRYEVPRRLGEKWLRHGQLLPLLDGLDEVELENRVRCAQAINNFRKKYLEMPTVVTCRTHDYKALATRLHLEEAIVLQPLSGDQIDLYLAGVGNRLAGLRAAIKNDATLRELAESPLMLSIMTLAYYRMPEDVAISLGNREEGRTLLFDVYVERMMRYRGGDELYDPEDSLHWLSWLAGQMTRHNMRMVFLEGMQPNWLQRPDERKFVERLRFSLGGWFLLLGVVAGLLALVTVGWQGFATGVATGVITAVIPTFGRVLLTHTRVNWHHIDTVEMLNWSWVWAWAGLGLGAIGGAILGGLLSLMTGQFSVIWIVGFAMFGATSQVLEDALVREDMKLRTTPKQGIMRSAENGRRLLVATLAITAVLFTILLGIGAMLDVSVGQLLPFALWAAVYLASSAGLIFGGLATIQHRQLFKQFALKGVVPESDYVAFLDYAAERSLLRKVGGGYIFVHALLLDYFCNRLAISQNNKGPGVKKFDSQ